MLLLNVHVCVGFLVSLAQRSCQSCTQGKPQECLDAEFVPGSNLAGEGFDITKMERKGAFVINMNQWKYKDKTCTLCRNPYLDNKKQKLPVSVVDWRSQNFCTLQITSSLHRSSESLVASSSSSVDNSWGANLDINAGNKAASMMLAGTQSKLAEYSMEKTKSDKFSFTSQTTSCVYYSYRISGSPKLNKDFRKAVRELPKTYSPTYKQRFYRLIDDFGTHYITKVKLGGAVRSVTSIRQCQASLQGLTTEEVQMCLEAEASATIKATVKVELKHCKKDTEKMELKTSFSGLFNDRFTEIKGGQTTEPDLLFSSDKDPSAYKEWLNTLPLNPDIISYSLNSLHELLPKDDPARKNLRSAISHYILEKGLWRNCSEPCQAGIRGHHGDPCVCQCHNNPGVNHECCPTRKGTARVIITVQRAVELWGDHTTATDGYVKVFFNNMMVHRSNVINNNNDPHWGAEVDLGTQDVTGGKKVKFEVWDQDNHWDDDHLGTCEQVLSAGAQQEVCSLNHGRLYYSTRVECAPSLSGPSCSTYKPSPMSQRLRSVYTSRHAHPIPKAVLAEMGVFVNEAGSTGNQSQSSGRQMFGFY